MAEAEGCHTRCLGGRRAHRQIGKSLRFHSPGTPPGMDALSTGEPVVRGHVDLHGTVERSGRRDLAEIVYMGVGIRMEAVVEALAIGNEANDIASVDVDPTGARINHDCAVDFQTGGRGVCDEQRCGVGRGSVSGPRSACGPAYRAGCKGYRRHRARTRAGRRRASSPRGRPCGH
jgi:hypothetical protein